MDRQAYRTQDMGGSQLAASVPPPRDTLALSLNRTAEVLMESHKMAEIIEGKLGIGAIPSAAVHPEQKPPGILATAQEMGVMALHLQERIGRISAELS